MAAIISCSVATLIAVITKYSYVFGYIQRGFGNGISVAQARVRMQSGHAKGTRGVRRFIMGKILPLAAWMFVLLIIETPTSQSVDLFTCQWNVSKMRLGRHVRYMMTTFLAGLDLNCETKKKYWVTYRKLEVLVFSLFSRYVCPRKFVKQTVGAYSILDLFVFSIESILHA